MQYRRLQRCLSDHYSIAASSSRLYGAAPDSDVCPLSLCKILGSTCAISLANSADVPRGHPRDAVAVQPCSSALHVDSHARDLVLPCHGSIRVRLLLGASPLKLFVR